MNDKELADKIVGLGVGYRSGPHAYGIFLAEGTSERIGDPSDLARDWRVTGALMEMCAHHKFRFGFRIGGSINAGNHVCQVSAVHMSVHSIEIENESLPRAINEACVEALS